MKTVIVDSYDELSRAITYWAGRGLEVTAQTSTSAVLARPRRPSRGFGFHLGLSLLTLGVYPLAILIWWVLLAWWVKPLLALSRTDRVTIRAR